ncbi:unnamed protein product [Amoebophrya sp. A120]|nr:unnamed protein product [Amoebophrya sp. A120]|eukprot:GSA120T00009813001.1
MATFNNQFEPIVRMEVDSFEDFDHENFEQPDHNQTIPSATIKPPKRLSVADSEEDLLLQPKRRMIEESDNNLKPHQLAESVPTPLSPGKRVSKSPGKKTAANGLQAASKPASATSIAPQGLPSGVSASASTEVPPSTVVAQPAASSTRSKPIDEASLVLPIPDVVNTTTTTDVVAGQQQLLEQGEPMHLTGTTNTAATSSSGSASSTSSTTQHNATSTKINRRMPLPPVRYTRPRTVNLNNNGTTSSTTTGSVDHNGAAVVQFPPRTGTTRAQQQQQHLRNTTAGNTNPTTAPAPYVPSNNPVYTHRNIGQLQQWNNHNLPRGFQDAMTGSASYNPLLSEMTMNNDEYRNQIDEGSFDGNRPRLRHQMMAASSTSPDHDFCKTLNVGENKEGSKSDDLFLLANKNETGTTSTLSSWDPVVEAPANNCSSKISSPSFDDHQDNYSSCSSSAGGASSFHPASGTTGQQFEFDPCFLFVEKNWKTETVLGKLEVDRLKHEHAAMLRRLARMKGGNSKMGKMMKGQNSKLTSSNATKKNQRFRQRSRENSVSSSEEDSEDSEDEDEDSSEEPSEAEPEEEELSDEDESMGGDVDNNSSSKRVAEVQLPDKENINEQLTSKIDEDSDFSEDSDSSNGDDERMQVDGPSTVDSTSANKNAGKEMLNGAGSSSSSGASSSSASASNTTTTTAESCQNKDIDAKKKHSASIMKSPSDEKKLVLPVPRCQFCRKQLDSCSAIVIEKARKTRRNFFHPACFFELFGENAKDIQFTLKGEKQVGGQADCDDMVLEQAVKGLIRNMNEN